MAQQFCGQCNAGFNSEEDYLIHTCIDGLKPTEPKHLGKAFIIQSEEALKRGEENEI